MRSCSARLDSGVVIDTISTFSNWCWRSIPAVSLPALPASERKHWVCAVMRMGRAAPSRISPATVLVSVTRSEEHTSELQSRENLVCRLLLEKKKKAQEYL